MPIDHSFGPGRRLRTRTEYSAVFEAKVRATAMPLVLYALPGSSGASRLGLSIGRPVGNAVKRNRIKRRLREAFRLHRHEWPGVYDITLVVRPGEALEMQAYARLINGLVEIVHTTWVKRGKAPPGPFAAAGRPRSTENGARGASREKSADARRRRGKKA